MAERTFCPACSAPLEIPDGQETVECSFCNARFTVHIEDGDQILMEVASQPEPQKDVLSQQASRVLDETLSDSQEQAADQSTQQAFQTNDEVAAPGFTSLETGKADPTAVGLPESAAVSGAQIYESLNEPDTPAVMPRPPYQVPDPGAGIGGSAVPEVIAPPGKSQRNRWIAIGLAVFVVTCILCACVAGAAMLFLAPTLQSGIQSPVSLVQLPAYLFAVR
jgi:LSD1 subclass zinc finger protein